MVLDFSRSQVAFLAPSSFCVPLTSYNETRFSQHSLTTQRTAFSKVHCSDSGWQQISPREKRVVLVPQTWHNRTGDIVRQVLEDVWVVERGYIFLGKIDVGGRTTIVRLADGGLFVHAPLALTPVLKRCIDRLGIVRVVVAPNTEHVDFIQQWAALYPEACYLGPPACLSTHPQIPFTRELSRDNIVDQTLAGSEISQFFVASAPFFNETLFVHHPTRSLLCTDFFWSYPCDPDVPQTTRAWAWAMNNIYKPVYDWILVIDQREFTRVFDDVMSSGFHRIIPCHGDIIESNGQEVLSAFFENKRGR